VLWRGALPRRDQGAQFPDTGPPIPRLRFDAVENVAAFQHRYLQTKFFIVLIGFLEFPTLSRRSSSRDRPKWVGTLIVFEPVTIRLACAQAGPIRHSVWINARAVLAWRGRVFGPGPSNASGRPT